MAVDPEEVENIVLYQVGALNAFLDFHDMALNHIKVHGALAGMVAEDADLMVAVGRVCQQYDVGFFGFAGTEHEAVCQKMGIKFVPELYVDLNYAADGSLIILRKPVTTDPEKAKDRVEAALRGKPVAATDGTELNIDFESVCVHSDSPNSPDVAAAVRSAIDEFTATA